MSEIQPHLSYEQFAAQAPAVQAAMRALGKAADEAGLDKALLELIKLRASQINGCAFCLHMHLGIGRKLGIDGDKLDLVSAWREADIFTEREQAALAWTEALTLMDGPDAQHAIYEDLIAHFSDTEVLFLTVAIGTINQWNRIAIGLRFPIARKV